MTEGRRQTPGLSFAWVVWGMALLPLALPSCWWGNPDGEWTRWTARDALKEAGTDAAVLLEDAKRLFNDLGTPEDNQKSLVFSHKAAVAEPESWEAWYVAGRSCTWLWEYGVVPFVSDKEGRDVRGADCVGLARKAVSLAPEEPSALYVLCVAAGLEIEAASIIGKPLKLGGFVELLEKMVELDDSLDEGGALRMLGAIRLKAPEWPTGPGDLDEALELLGDAVKRFPLHPLNHLFYAEALLEDGDSTQAREHIAEAVRLNDPERFGWRYKDYYKRIEKVARSL